MRASRASHTAYRVALHRAVHQVIDTPRVLEDPLAFAVLAPTDAERIRAAPERFARGLVAPFLRAAVVARSRFAEDHLAAARCQGVRQYVILGAGLDTSAYRLPAAPGPIRVWEVDHPASQAEKRSRLCAAGIASPPELRYVPVDLERDRLADRLEAEGFAPEEGALFAWLGVTYYLTAPAIATTLAYLRRATTAGGGVAFDYAVNPSRGTWLQRIIYRRMAARVRRIGEPWLSTFNPEQLISQLHAIGFPIVRDHDQPAINGRYFANRADRLQVGGMTHLMWAGAGEG